MTKVFGGPGTWSGLLLRISQYLFAWASISSMRSAVGFSNYTAFCYTISSMALQTIWSLGRAVFDICALKEDDLHNPSLVNLLVLGDWVTAVLSLAAACSSAGVTLLLVKDTDFCKTHPQFSCGRYQMSSAMAFVTWLLVAVSALVTLRILTSN